MGRKKNSDQPSEEELLLQALSGPPKKATKPQEPVEPSPPEKSAPLHSPTSKRGQKNTKRGRVDIIRQTAHRGGKGVTVVKNFVGIGLQEKQELAKKMQRACGVGGTVKDGCIEIQGDNREEVKRILTEAGFNPVFAGG